MAFKVFIVASADDPVVFCERKRRWKICGAQWEIFAFGAGI